MWLPCIARHVSTKTTTSAIPGSTAHAISIARRLARGDASSARLGARATERRMAVCANAQQTAEIQKMVSVKRKDIEQLMIGGDERRIVRGGFAAES